MPVENETARTLTDLLFEEATVGRCLVAPDGTVLRANAEWLRSTGLDEERVVGENILDLFPETRDVALALHGRARAGHRVEVPRHARTVNGREAWWDGSVEPVSMDGGTGLLLTAREVTDPNPMFVFDEENGVERRKRAESTRRDELFVQQSRDIILFVGRDDGRILEANSAAIAAYGYSRDELLARSILDLRAPETREVLETQMHEAQTRGVLFESLHRRSDGSTFPVEVSSRGVTVDGTPILIRVVRDITERRRIDESLRESEERLSAAFAASPDAINITRLRDGAYVSVNDGFARLSGWSADEVLGRTAAELGLWVDQVERACLMERLLAGEPVQDAETHFRRKDGTVFTASLSARTFTARGERFLLAITRDVSNLKRAEEALREADRRKDEFLGMLSHELRNPLAPIRNSTFLLRHAAPGSEQARRAQSVIERQVEHVTRLVDDLLDVTRIARGKIELRRSRIDLREVMLHAADDFRLIIQNRGVTLRTSLPEANIWVDADGTRIAQLIGNLLHNAAKFTSRGDEVTLSLSVTGGEAEVRVRDTGAGIEPAVLPHVFEAFVQGERTLARTEGGLGLGLALAPRRSSRPRTCSTRTAGAAYSSWTTTRTPRSRWPKSSACSVTPPRSPTMGRARSRRRARIRPRSCCATSGCPG
jgi:PAS domain S-box-containing protein